MLSALLLSAVLSMPQPSQYYHLVPDLEVMRFYPPKLIRPAWYGSMAYRDYMRDKRLMGPTAIYLWNDAIEQAEFMETAWNLLDSMEIYRTNKYLFDEYREKLQKHLGDEAFRRGFMPIPAPNNFVYPK